MKAHRNKRNRPRRDADLMVELVRLAQDLTCLATAFVVVQHAAGSLNHLPLVSGG